MGNDVTITEAITTVSSSGVNTDVSISSDSTTVEVAGAKQIILNQQATEVTVGYTTTTVEIDENATQLTVVSPHYSAEIPFSTDISVPSTSFFKSSVDLSGEDHGFKIGMSFIADDFVNVAFEPQNEDDNIFIGQDGGNFGSGDVNLTAGRYGKIRIRNVFTNFEVGVFAQDTLTTPAPNAGVQLRSSQTKDNKGLLNITNLSGVSQTSAKGYGVLQSFNIQTSPFGSGTGRQVARIGATNAGANPNNSKPFFADTLGFGIKLSYNESTSLSGLHPCNELGYQRDNRHSLGTAGNKWHTVYAGTGTINTSDINLKQDIEDLTEAETRVAVACKSLIKKFKWRDSVEQKGSDARIHVGIMAQDLQQAFISEGLDPNKYGMFCQDIWWEADVTYPAQEEERNEDGEIVIEACEETTVRETYYSESDAPSNAQRISRLGVRYDQLLAFIISVI